MSWLFKSDWAASPRNPANADLDNIAKDIKTWGGNVDAGGNSLVNCAAVYGLSGANPLLFWANGAERMRLDSSGRLGIATTSPASTLQVGTGTALAPGVLDVFGLNSPLATAHAQLNVLTTDAMAPDVGGCIGLGGKGSGNLYLFGTVAGRSENNLFAGYLQFATVTSVGGLTERMRVTSGGNVGIGTTNPLSAFSVRSVSTGGKTGDVACLGVSTDTALGIVLGRSGVTNPRELWLGLNQATGYGEIQAAQGGVGFNTPLVLNRSGGNVGIGETNPPARLTVAQAGGDGLKVRYNTGYPSIGFAVGGSSGWPALTCNLTWASGNVWNYESTNTSWYLGDPGGTNKLNLGIAAGTVGATFSPTIALCIDSSARVGIAVTTMWAGLQVYHATSTPGGAATADCAFSHTDNNLQLTSGICSSPSWGAWFQAKHASAGSSPYPIYLNPAGGGVIQNAPANWAGDGVLNNNQLSIWYDESNNRLAIRVRSSAGVLKTGYVTVS